MAGMNATPPKHRLRWYQYSLRSLFVLTILVAVAGSWFGVKKQQKEQERAAVKAIEEMGGLVFYDYQVHNRRAEPPGPAWLRAWLGDDFFAHPVAVRLNGTKVTDAGLEHLSGSTKLFWLDLSGTKVTDEGVEKLQEALPNCKIYR